MLKIIATFAQKVDLLWLQGRFLLRSFRAIQDTKIGFKLLESETNLTTTLAQGKI